MFEILFALFHLSSIAEKEQHKKKDEFNQYYSLPLTIYSFYYEDYII